MRQSSSSISSSSPIQFAGTTFARVRRISNEPAHKAATSSWRHLGEGQDVAGYRATDAGAADQVNELRPVLVSIRTTAGVTGTTSAKCRHGATAALWTADSDTLYPGDGLHLTEFDRAR